MVTAGWMPTASNYFGRVTKARILQAVREAKGDQFAEQIGHLKKADMAREAERLLSGSGWLPEPLRMTGNDDNIDGGPVGADVAGGDEAETAPDAQSLPAFHPDEPGRSGEDASDTQSGIDGRRLAAAE
jgi:ParB family chromosome partitioning protein